MTDTDSQGATGSAPSVLVTGAAGGLGVHLVRALHEQGWEVIAYDVRTVEETGRQSLVSDLDGVTWMRGRGAHLEPAVLRRCQAVVHAAGIASLSARQPDLIRVNHDLTEALFRQCAITGVEHFVYISCASVYRTDAGVRTEQSATEAYNAFDESKLDAEDTLQKLGDQLTRAPALTILRLGLLYGPGCTSMGAGLIPLPAILRGVSRYLPGLTGGPRTNWCHVEDAASATALVVDSDQGRGRIFNVADETPLSFGEVLTSIIEGYGIDLGPSVRMPRVALWTLLGPLLDTNWSMEQMRGVLRFLWRRVLDDHGLDSPLVPRLNRDALFYIRDDAIVVADAMRQLGWEPKWPDFRQGIAATIRWYQQQGWAPRFDLDALAERRNGESREAKFSYQEHLRGQLDAEGKRQPVEIDLRQDWPSLPVPPTRRQGRLEGELTIPGIADSAAIKGTVDCRWLPTPELEYQFGFRNLNGRACRFRGKRQVNPTSPLLSALHLRGTLYDDRGRTAGTVTLRSAEGVLPLLAATRATETT